MLFLAKVDSLDGRKNKSWQYFDLSNSDERITFTDLFNILFMPLFLLKEITRQTYLYLRYTWDAKAMCGDGEVDDGLLKGCFDQVPKRFSLRGMVLIGIGVTGLKM
jgi:hypothetical protein